MSAPVCQCGCGSPVGFYTSTNRARGIVAGQPKRFLTGHHLRRRSYTPTDLGYTTPCWVWDHALNVAGYGRLRHDGRAIMAHRFYYELARGPVPAGLDLDHLCRNPACVNPDHLEAVTRAVNTRRGRRTKLSDYAVLSIRLMRLTTTMSAREIGEALGVTGSAVQCVISGQTARSIA